MKYTILAVSIFVAVLGAALAYTYIMEVRLNIAVEKSLKEAEEKRLKAERQLEDERIERLQRLEYQKMMKAKKEAEIQEAINKRRLAAEREKNRIIELQRFVMKKEYEFEQNYKAGNCTGSFVQCADAKKQAKVKFFEEQGIKHLYDEARRIENERHGIYINNAR